MVEAEGRIGGAEGRIEEGVELALRTPEESAVWGKAGGVATKTLSALARAENGCVTAAADRGEQHQFCQEFRRG